MTDQKPIVLTSQQAIEDYVDDLIKTKNSPYVNDGNRAEVKKMLLDEVNAVVNRKLISKLTDGQVDELNKLLEVKTADEKIAEFFKQKIPDLDKTVLEALIDFRKGYLVVNYQEKKLSSTLPTNN